MKQNFLNCVIGILRADDELATYLPDLTYHLECAPGNTSYPYITYTMSYKPQALWPIIQGMLTLDIFDSRGTALNITQGTERVVELLERRFPLKEADTTIAAARLWLEDAPNVKRVAEAEWFTTLLLGYRLYRCKAVDAILQRE